MTKGKIASALVASTYLAVAFIGGGAEAGFKCIMFLILPLACIWFSDALGGFTGTMRGQYINAETPGCLVALGGWLILLLPVIIAAIHAFNRN